MALLLHTAGEGKTASSGMFLLFQNRNSSKNEDCVRISSHLTRSNRRGLVVQPLLVRCFNGGELPRHPAV
jgi:hypothetical protein